MLDSRGSFPAMLDSRGSFPAMLDSRGSFQRCLMPFLAMLDPEVLPMQRSLPSVGSLAHTTSRTTRTENPARCRLLDARLHDYTTPNTTRRPTQHDAQHNTTPNTPRSTERNTRSATHVCRQPAIPRPTRVPQYTRPLLQHPHMTAPTPPTRPPPMIIAEHFGIWLWFFVGALVSCLVRFSLGP